MKTKKIHSRSTVNDIYALLGIVIRLAGSYDFSADAYLTGIFTKLKEWYDNLTDSVNAVVERSNLAPLDHDRDDALRSLFYEIKSKCHWHEDAVKEAALKIDELLKRYGVEITELSYAHETTQLNALLDDLKKTEIMSAIALLPGLSDVIANLTQKQLAFETATDTQLTHKADQKDLHTASHFSKLAFDKINNELLVYVIAMRNALQGDYANYAKELDEAIAENNSNVRAHLNKLKADRKNDTPSTDDNE